ncbi:MAG: hypothetical protein DPW11_04030 [bacterium]|nr:hypothetical protein [bacterium]
MIGNVINLGNPTEHTLSEALRIFESVIGAQLATVQVDVQSDDPKKRKPDIARAKEILNWEPVVDFKTGIKNTLDYYLSL